MYWPKTRVCPQVLPPKHAAIFTGAMLQRASHGPIMFVCYYHLVFDCGVLRVVVAIGIGIVAVVVVAARWLLLLWLVSSSSLLCLLSCLYGWPIMYVWMDGCMHACVHIYICWRLIRLSAFWPFRELSICPPFCQKSHSYSSQKQIESY